ncbi:MAG: hypothetical protein HC819_08620 [Cyclobacteriaceae bacterium]|nr:hypothetical protein [Cyclobacteriaceae bacterium]
MRLKMLSAIMAIVVVGMSYGCQSDKYKVSEDGYEYKFVKKVMAASPSREKLWSIT